MKHPKPLRPVEHGHVTLCAWIHPLEGSHWTGALGLAKVQRHVVYQGTLHTVECGLRADGTSPALEFLDDLRRGMWEPDADVEKLPADEQIADRAKILSLIRHLADTGEPRYSRAVNFLVDGIWEIKYARTRLAFYDTFGDGTYEARNKILDYDDRDCDGDFWWFPQFEPLLRLGHAFPKTTDKTLPEDLNAAQQLRMEDLTHDQR